MRLHPLLLLLKAFNNLKELTPFWPGWKAQTFNRRYQVFASVYFCMHHPGSLAEGSTCIPKMGAEKQLPLMCHLSTKFYKLVS